MRAIRLYRGIRPTWKGIIIEPIRSRKSPRLPRNWYLPKPKPPRELKKRASRVKEVETKRLLRKKRPKGMGGVHLPGPADLQGHLQEVSPGRRRGGQVGIAQLGKEVLAVEQHHRVQILGHAEDPPLVRPGRKAGFDHPRGPALVPLRCPQGPQVREGQLLRLALEETADAGDLDLGGVGGAAAAHQGRGQAVEQAGVVHQLDVHLPAGVRRLKALFGLHVIVVVGAGEAPVHQALALWLAAEAQQERRGGEERQHHQRGAAQGKSVEPFFELRAVLHRPSTFAFICP
jgi:hypothetical protein